MLSRWTHQRQPLRLPPPLSALSHIPIPQSRIQRIHTPNVSFRWQHGQLRAQSPRWRKSLGLVRIQHRQFFTEAIPPTLLPPVVFVGLLLALWTWKCVMMVLFQDKIIYMPSMPPFARREKVESYTDARGLCNGVKWEEVKIKSADGVRLSVLVGKVETESTADMDETSIRRASTGQKNVFIIYFQGNGSSLPPRLPILSSVLRSVHMRTSILKDKVTTIRYTLVALSYRGYWTSTGRAMQSGIELDAQAILHHINTTLATPQSEIILWGQSIGAGVATTSASSYIQRHHQQAQTAAKAPKITALVLETPFTSVKNMLIALYPQKWLPYRYLHPFLWNRWDSEVALKRIAALSVSAAPEVLLLPATRDEVVPPEDAGKLEKLCKEIALDVRRVDVLGALHHEATLRKDGQEAIAKFIVDVAQASKL